MRTWLCTTGYKLITFITGSVPSMMSNKEWLSLHSEGPQNTEYSRIMKWTYLTEEPKHPTTTPYHIKPPYLTWMSRMWFSESFTGPCRRLDIYNYIYNLNLIPWTISREGCGVLELKYVWNVMQRDVYHSTLYDIKNEGLWFLMFLERWCWWQMRVCR